MRLVAAAAAALFLLLPAPVLAQTEDEGETAVESPIQESGGLKGAPLPVAVLQGLDKITARISTLEAGLDQMVTFGSLEIVPRACHKTPPEEPPESAAFLEITDVRPDAEAIRVFTGWMFASSPALSAMEHPVYDVWVLDCKAPSAEGDDNSAAE